MKKTKPETVIKINVTRGKTLQRVRDDIPTRIRYCVYNDNNIFIQAIQCAYIYILMSVTIRSV